MKFSHTLLKKLAAKIPDKAKLVDALNLHAFETAVAGDDTVEISISANRYSDAASHWGIAKVAAAIFGGKAADLGKGKETKVDRKGTKPEVKILAKSHCPRYIARYFELPRVAHSPQWLKDALFACGLRPINAVVDIMNYVMLEVGQPLHAFDAEKIDGGITVRFAKKGEDISAIDGGNFALSANDLVIADEKGPLAIAGIKGGKRAEIAAYSRKIIVEAANFDGAGIYKTARSLNLFTDASSRFSHGLSPILADIAMRRAGELLKEICKAKAGEAADVNYSKLPKVVLRFDIREFNRLTGLNLKEKAALEYLTRAGFAVKGRMVAVPPARTDIAFHADLAEEIINLYGYDNLPEAAPHVPLAPAQKEDKVSFREKIREVLRGFGMSEVYNYSFVSRKDLTKYADPKWWGALPLRNPISSDFQYLRPNLGLHLLRNAEDNFRFYDEVRIFEVGNIFKEKDGELSEEPFLGIALGFKKGNPILELKGLVDQLLSELGLVDYFFRDLNWDLKFMDQDQSLRIEANHEVIGYLGMPKEEENVALAEIFLAKLLKLASEEKEYEALSKYPSVTRDLSLYVDQLVRVNELMEIFENAAPQYLDDVDLIDFYEDQGRKGGKKSLTFRFVFLAEDHTLTDEEVGHEMEKIIAALQEKLDVEIR